ncbi:MAG: hypothetical protein DMG91_06335 [Acidobacteria bacterium]|nr:MAG: hypothetical protein DMG91_06335 [Acidobacteriota bacterium]
MPALPAAFSASFEAITLSAALDAITFGADFDAITFGADFDAITFGADFEAITLLADTLFDTTGATRRVLAMIAFWVAVRLLIKDFFWIDIALSSGFFYNCRRLALLCCKPLAKLESELFSLKTSELRRFSAKVRASR